MGQIDELSQMIGAIQADVLHIRRNTEVSESKLDKLVEQGIVQGQSISAAHKRIDEIIPIVKDYEATKNQGKGGAKVLTGVASVFGFLGGGLVMLLKHLFGG